MPIADPEKRREYMRKYEEERRLGLRRTGTVAEVEAAMAARAAEREQYRREWKKANRERLAKQRRERRAKERQAQLAAALGRLAAPDFEQGSL